MRKFFPSFLLWMAFWAMAAVACRSPEKQSPTVFFRETDAYGREVTLREEPQRIVSLSPAITEILFLLDAQDKLVGVSDFCDYPPAARSIPKVGGMQNINMEVLLALRPDVVLIGSIVSAEDVKKIENMHIPVVAVREERKLEGMADMMTMLGKITGCREAADRESRQWLEKIARLRQQNAQDSVARKSVYYVVGFGEAGDFTAPRNSHIHEMIVLAGGKNAGAPLRQWGVSREFLFQADPDIILVRSEDCEAFCSRYPYTLLTAVRQHRVYPIESGSIDVVSLRNIDAVEYIRKLLQNS